MRRKSNIWVAAGLALTVAAFSGCRVRVDKDSQGKEKTVQVDTPFGGIHVNTDQISASDLGLPAYPGATQVKDNDKNKSADVHMGFGEWQLRVRAVNYETTDSKEQVTAFYKKALGRFGDVLTCQDKEPVGTPTATAEGLSCSDDGNHQHFKFNNKDYSHSDGFQLKAGSKRHQHIVGFEDAEKGNTKFALIALDLPANVDSSDHSD
ncbi:MAG TPA: hypothetical protein VGJ21_19020 [Terracidiphilus sp.]|jgi:hypothetical protein